ncbi:hypothetical protein PNK_0717 [Candidatus Protochlamydia naegleriophila]|uniref:Protein kinase domain-containing protein n=1 Tax=Candidatus Protochlamydia naegleriophila TaxID=389348 RepID=A0A0U5JB46_9BACT|nr:protein kinase [Candidatus Protochlamydia naegleriophila]CUI16343.1 hypothetical protein PNK_0717 [Candidatus Protochlamydia naegleriophila]
MQANQPQNLSPHPFLWADWLNSIAENPQHGKIVQEGSKFRYLNDKQAAQTAAVRVVSFQSILELTQANLESRDVCAENKTKMLSGLRYISKQRQERYQNLFFIFRWCAKLLGVEKKLSDEKAFIDQLAANPVAAALQSRIAPQSSQVPSVKVAAQSQVNDLSSFNEFVEYYHGSLSESVYAYSNHLRALKKTLLPSDLQRKEITAAENALASQLPHWPRVKDIVKVFGEDVLRPTFKETIENLYQDHVNFKYQPTAEQIERDKTLFQCTESEIKALYVKRLIKAERTDFSLSLITAIETTWQEMIARQEKKSVEVQIEQYRALVIPGEDGGVFLKEDFLNSGSYKAAFVATHFLPTVKSAERSEFVVLQPADKVEEEIKHFQALKAPQPSKPGTDSDSDSDSYEYDSDSSNSLGSSVVMHTVGTSDTMIRHATSSSSSSSGPLTMICLGGSSDELDGIALDQHKAVLQEGSSQPGTGSSSSSEESSGTMVILKSLPHDEPQGIILQGQQGSPSDEIVELDDDMIESDDQMEPDIVDPEQPSHPVRLTINKTLIQPLVKAPTVNSVFDEEAEAFKKEAELCVRLGKLPGIWPTHKITTVNGQVAIIQKKAGYAVEGKDKQAIELYDMALLAHTRELSVKDQIAFLDMIEWFLKGVKSIHEQNLIHRDIKPGNILCTSDGKAGLSDFGLVCGNESEERQTLIGTPYFIAPEIVYYNNSRIQGENWKKIDGKADIWAVGLTLWDMLSGENAPAHPANDNIASPTRAVLSMGQLFIPMQQAKYYKRYETARTDRYGIIDENGQDERSKGYRMSLFHLIKQCTEVEPEKRPTIDQVMQHFQTWKQEAVTLLQDGKITSVIDVF